MKYIKSSTGSNIVFKLSGKKTVTIEPTIPLEVSDEEFKILNTRLGTQLSLVTKDVPVEVTEEVSAPVEVAPTEPEATEEVSAPVEVTEEV